MALTMNRMCAWAFVRELSERMPTAANNYLKIYKGTIPEDANDYVEANHTDDLLVTFNNFTLAQSVSNNKLLAFNTLPNPSVINASATGTATWFAIYPTTNTTIILLGDVTNEAGNGTLRLNTTTNLVSGNPVSISSLHALFL